MKNKNVNFLFHGTWKENSGKSEKTDREFLSLVSEGIVLWDRLAYEDSF